MRATRNAVALAGALALAVTLAACGGTPAGPDLEKLRTEFVGSWELESAEFDDQSISEEDYDSMSETLDMHVTLDLSDEGELLVDAFGSQQEGSWEIKDEDTLTLTLGDEGVDVPYEDERLTLTYDGETMVFSKVSDEPVMDRDPSVNAGGGSLDQFDDLPVEDTDDDPIDDTLDEGDTSLADELFTDEMYAWADTYAADVTVSEPLDVTVGDDDTALVKIVGVGADFEGETGYLMSFENRTDQDLVFTNISTTLEGEDVYYDATLARPVRAGETVQGFFYFDASLGEVTSASSCSFSIMAIDRSDAPVAVYSATL
ncbi:hypothetical protein [Olsenella sp. An188]|uniref:hypothetical protein n=1 Tax=Olsenella sp. An188 TaxID=1965579 RepID=UPI000B36D329|nr:hypothetical protein [Olsenella sp. An188]OUP39201.1 hypothetical protein B5F23_03530 [Olsenella sp. An188]HBO61753.1 hypothetical protein [Olsenella sp.]HJB55200.1 hypothetical protein [Candidatus Olsenella avistercoris]